MAGVQTDWWSSRAFRIHMYHELKMERSKTASAIAVSCNMSGWFWSMVDVYPLVSLDAFINHAAAASPARAKSPGIMPAQPLRDRNLEDRSIMDLMWARSSEY